MGNFRLKIVLTVIMLVFSILPAVIVGAVGTFSVMGYESSVKQNTLRQVAEAKSAGIAELFSHYITGVTASSKVEAVIDGVNGDGSADELLSAIKSADSDIIDVLILSGDGTVVLSLIHI